MLSELQKAKIPNLFQMFDANKNGVLDKKDIVRIINTCAVQKRLDKTSEAYNRHESAFLGLWVGMTALADKNMDDKVTLEEFLAFFDYLIESKNNYKGLVNGISEGFFCTFDQDNDGALTFIEYRQFYEAMGLDERYARTIFNQLDLDSNGSISIKTLKILIDQFFRSQDVKSPGNQFFGPIKQISA